MSNLTKVEIAKLVRSGRKSVVFKRHDGMYQDLSARVLDRLDDGLYQVLDSKGEWVVVDRQRMPPAKPDQHTAASDLAKLLA